MSKKIHSEEAPSKEFMDAVVDGGGIWDECDLCGRTHFSSLDANYDYEEGEYEELCEKEAKDPDSYMEADGSVGYGYIDGKRAVWGCKCNGMRKYEDWVWAHRRIITEYLSQRTDKELKNALYERNRVESIAGTPGLLLLDWLRNNGLRVEGSMVHNGSYWSQVTTVNPVTVKVGVRSFDVHSPASFEDVAEYLRQCDADAKEWMHKKNLQMTNGVVKDKDPHSLW